VNADLIYEAFDYKRVKAKITNILSETRTTLPGPDGCHSHLSVVDLLCELRVAAQS